ncbi:MAG: hypothetical protein JWO80_6285 [Bryobacterales bacterium]|nr:hypothetical protein [Bryobacterales bacterium]
MPGHDDLQAHFSGALHDRVKVVYLEPQQYTVSVWLAIAITDRTVIVFYFEAVQLKDKFAIRDHPLIFGTPMIAPAAQQTLIPSAACSHIGYGDERLGTHPHQRNNSSLTPKWRSGRFGRRHSPK